MVICEYRDEVMLKHLAVRDNPLALHVKAYSFILLFCGRYPKVAYDILRRIWHSYIVLKSDYVVNVWGFLRLVTTFQHTPCNYKLVGTLMYMAPEQFGGSEQVDGKADVYALGVVLYELLTGEVPFLRPILATLSKTPLPLQELRPDVPAGLSSLILRMLSADAEARPDMTLVEQQLTRARPELPAGPKPAQPKIRSYARHPLALVALMVAAAAAGLYGSGHLRVQKLTIAESKAQARATLEQALRSPSTAIVLHAITALGQTGDLDHRVLLEPLLHHSDPRLVAAAAHSLGACGAIESQSALLQLLKQPRPAAVTVAVGDALAAWQHPEGVQLLLDVLEHGDRDSKVRATMVLLQHGNLAGAPLLWDSISHGNVSEVTSLVALGLLAQAGDPRARQLLTEKLRSRASPQGLLLAAWNLGKLGEDEGLQALQAATQKATPERLLAAQLLVSLGEPDAAACQLLADAARSSRESEEDRELAISALADCGSERGLSVLGPLLRPQAGSEPARIAVAGAILRLIASDRTQLAQQSLRRAKTALDSDSPVARELAAASLGEMDSDDTIEPLTQALRDQQREVRRTAARALGSKSARAALESLASSLDDQDVEVRATEMHAISRVVRSLRDHGDKHADQLVRDRLKRLARDGNEVDRVAATGILLQLGDNSQESRLRSFLTSADPVVGKLVIELIGADDGSLAGALADADRSVRFAAARRLADSGSRLGKAVLLEVARIGDIDGLMAYGKLKKLGETAAPPPGLSQILQSAELNVRLDALAAIADLSPEDALPVLLVASRDSLPVVRRRAGRLAGEFFRRSGMGGFLNLIKVLLHDADELVRAGATELLLTLKAAPLAVPALASSAATKPPAEPAAIVTPLTADSEEPPPAGSSATESRSVSPPKGEGMILLVGEESVRVQIDRGPSEAISNKPRALAAGRHRISFAGGSRDAAGSAGQTVTVNIPVTYAEQLLLDGQEALTAKRLDRAQEIFERLNLLAQRGKVKRTLLPDLKFHLGEIYESNDNLQKALQEYNELLNMPATILLGLVGLFFLGMGVFGLVSPAALIRPFGIELRGPEARAEVRAVYGGFGMAMAVLLALAAADVGALRRGAALATATALLGMAFGRVVAHLLEKPSRFYPSWFYFCVEVTGAVL